MKRRLTPRLETRLRTLVKKLKTASWERLSLLLQPPSSKASKYRYLRAYGGTARYDLRCLLNDVPLLVQDHDDLQWLLQELVSAGMEISDQSLTATTDGVYCRLCATYGGHGESCRVGRLDRILLLALTFLEEPDD